MIHAYDEMYLEKARIALGRMLDFAVYDLKYELLDFWRAFLNSSIAHRFETGDCAVIVGKSGVELAYEVIGKNSEFVKPNYTANRSEEYWTGWALAYYQWKTSLSFHRITEIVTIDEIRFMYEPYHEMDIRQFCDKMDELYRERCKETNLKRIRKLRGLTQAQLALQSGVPIRTIQQYEQGQKNINNAKAECVIKLSKALYCEPAELMEKVPSGWD
jgi:DNA-binding transcriptional regulator YiaG